MAQFDCNFHSYVLRHPVSINVTVPSISSCERDNPSHVLKARFPVIYLLHGGGNDRSCWLRYTSAERYAEEHRIALVTCSVGNSAYLNVENGERFYDFVADELPEFLSNYFPISTRPEDSYMVGYSMGGYGTILHTFTHPERFAAVGFFSPGIGLPNREGRPTNRPDGITLVKDAVAKGVKLPKIFICIGQNDFLYESVTQYHQLLDELGVAHRYDDLPGYEHEFAIWDRELEAFMDWLPRTDAYLAQVPYKI